MSTDAPILIEHHGGAYRVTRDDELLLVIPVQLFDSFAQDTVFPPSWQDITGTAHPVRRLYWNPDTRQFLMAGLERHTARVVEGHSTSTYRSFLQGFWLPDPPVLLLRPFWNPVDPFQPFDLAARTASLTTQLAFHHLLAAMRPPANWRTILNATSAYLSALGITSLDGSTDPDAIHELALVSPPLLGRPPAARLLDTLSQRHLKSVCPVLHGDRLGGMHALGLNARLGAEALLDDLGLDYQVGPLRPH